MGRRAGLVGDASGAVADLGVLVPIAAALVLRNGFDAATVFVCVGALYVYAGLYFRVPVPVQPIKAAAAIAIARGLPPATLSAAGIMLGAILLVLGGSGLSERLSRIFAVPIVRGIQFGVGLILVRAGWNLRPDPSAAAFAVAVVVAGVLIVASERSDRWPAALVIVLGGIAWSLATGSRVALDAGTWEPVLARRAFDTSVLWSALTLLVIPQIPLTFGNAVVALSDLERSLFGSRARRVTPTAVSVSTGIANIATGALGGMPMCHGSGGLSAHARAGARTGRMNLMIGGALLVLGLFFGPAALGILGLIPIAVLMGLLFFAGVTHAMLATDRSGYELVVALAMGAVGFITSNLAIALAVGLVLWWPVTWARHR
jgi:MFS superfamily sulfate permease-like transporter